MNHRHKPQSKQSIVHEITDWKKAERHGRASLPGKPKPEEERGDKCDCCMKEIDKEPIPVSTNSKELDVLGFGFPLYFIFLKYCIILIILLIVTYTAIGIFWSIKSNTNFCLKG